MKFSSLTNREIQESISAGVDAAFYRMITGITSCPSGDFWDALKTSMQNAFECVASNEIDKRSDIDNCCNKTSENISGNLINIASDMLIVMRQIKDASSGSETDIKDVATIEYLAKCFLNMAGHYKKIN